MKTPRRDALLRLPSLALLASGLLRASDVAGAQQAAPPDSPSPVAAPDWTAEDHYRYAVRSLNRGLAFARAIEHLKEAVRLAPENPDYHRALGCACADRFASLRYASLWAGMLANYRESYPGARSEWEREKAKAEKAGKPFTVEPPVVPPAGAIPTRDDDKPFTLDSAALAEQTQRLSVDSLRAFDRAVALAKTPAARAEAHYARGWGLLLMAQHGPLPAPADRSSTAGGGEWDAVEEARDAFREAVTLAPEVAAYWESLAWALTRVDMRREEEDEPEPAPAKPKRQETPLDAITAEEAFHAALHRDPKNAPLWHKLAREAAAQLGMRQILDSMLQEDGEAEATAQDLEEDARNLRLALDWFARAAKADPANAVPHYETARLMVKGLPFTALFHEMTRPTDQGAKRKKWETEARKEDALRAAHEAVAAVERGNAAAARYATVLYVPPVPNMIAKAWGYVVDVAELDLRPVGQERELARALAAYARDRARSGDRAEAMRALRAVRGMGEKMMGDWPLRDSGRFTGEVMNAALGRAVFATAQEALIAICREAGDAPSLARAEAEKAAFRARTDAWREAYKAATATRDTFLELY